MVATYNFGSVYIDQHTRFWYWSHMRKKHPINAHADVSSGAGGLNFGLSVH